jgi:hypothetical protein
MSREDGGNLPYRCPYCTRKKGAFTLFQCLLTGVTDDRQTGLGCTAQDRQRCARRYSWLAVVKPGPGRS